MEYGFDNAEVTKNSTILNVSQDNYFYLSGHFNVEVLNGCCYLDSVLLSKGRHNIQQSFFSPAHLFEFFEETTIKFTPTQTTLESLYELPKKCLALPTTKLDSENTKSAFLFKGIRIVSKSELTKMVIPESWKCVLKNMNTLVINDSLRISVVGPKGSGKSTFVNLLVNSLCLKKSVCVFDVDCGQPYSGIVGTFSLLVFDKQDFNESFIGRNPLYSRYFCMGSSSLSSNIPLVYHTIREMVNVYNNEFDNFPLIINTSGWVDGFGMELLQYILQLTSCEIVIDMSPNEGLKILDDVCKQRIVINSCTSNPNGFYSIISPTFRRQISFDSALDKASYCTFKFNEVCFGSFEDIFQNLPFIAHQRYVFLSHLPNLDFSIKCNTTENTLVCPLQLTLLPNVFGIGLIYVDTINKLLYIKTNVNDFEIQQVNMLIFSSIMEIPKRLPVFEEESKEMPKSKQRIIFRQEEFKHIRRRFD